MEEGFLSRVDSQLDVRQMGEGFLAQVDSQLEAVQRTRLALSSAARQHQQWATKPLQRSPSKSSPTTPKVRAHSEAMQLQMERIAGSDSSKGLRALRDARFPDSFVGLDGEVPSWHRSPKRGW